MTAKHIARALLLIPLLLAGTACTRVYYREPEMRDPGEYEKAPIFLEVEIEDRIFNLQYQADAELYQNMQRLIYIGEPAIPYLLEALDHENPRVRGSCAYILGMIHDRRTIPELVEHLDDPVAPVRYEVAASLGVMGENRGFPVLIEGLKDSDIRNRYKCHEALKLLTGLDFGYQHDGEPDLRTAAVKRWETWYREVGYRGL